MARWKAWWLDRHPEEVGAYSWSYLFERGKQIRPRLFCELWTYLCPERPVCVEGAFLVECAHVASLILDDLPWMDNATERRGWTTLHQQFSVRKALLLVHDIGELAYEVGRSCPLFQKEMEMAEEKEKEEKAEQVREKAKALWLGQWLDVSRSGSLYEIAAWKTGTLFEAVAEGVAHGVGLDPVFWKKWGNALGVLFQWIDDWDDREEDARIGQRNAFHEAPEETLAMYHTLWLRVVQGIGPSWWKRPFGAYLWGYFTRILPTSDPVALPALSTLPTWFDTLPLGISFSLPLSSIPLSSLLLSSLSLSSSSNTHLPPSLRFMQLFLPYLERQVTVEEKKELRKASPPEDWDIVELWGIPEEEWMGILEKKGKTCSIIRGCLPSLRVVESMCRMSYDLGTAEAEAEAEALGAIRGRAMGLRAEEEEAGPEEAGTTPSVLNHARRIS
jgi:hypothetical protein